VLNEVSHLVGFVSYNLCLEVKVERQIVVGNTV
jgi:hypothetical protein